MSAVRFKMKAYRSDGQIGTILSVLNGVAMFVPHNNATEELHMFDDLRLVDDEDEVTISPRTGKPIDYAYYHYLQYAYKDGTITNDERFDLELAMGKFAYDSFYR